MKNIFVLSLFWLAALGSVSAGEPSLLSEEDQKTVAELIVLVKDTANPVRINHLKKLARYDCPQLLDTLKTCLDDPDEKLACTAMEIIQTKKISSMVPDIAAKIQSGSPVIAATAAYIAADMDIINTIPMLLNLLEHDKAGVRETAARLLKRHTGFDYDFNPDGTAEERGAGVSKWNSWWERNKGRTQAEWWINGLTDESAKNRSSSCQRLSEAYAYQSVPQLITTLADESAAVRYFANYALTKITSFDFGFEAEAPPAKRDTATAQWLAWWNANKSRQPREWWIEGLKFDSVQTRVSCILRLKQENCLTAIPDIIETINANQEIVRLHAKTALEALSGIFIKYDPSSEDENILLAAKNDWRAWWNDNKNKTKLEWLVATLSAHKYPETRTAAAETLESFTGDRKIVTPYLFAALNDTNARVRESAFISLKNMNSIKGIEFDAEAPVEERKKTIDKISAVLFGK